MFGPNGFDLGWDGSAPIIADLTARNHELVFNDKFEICREPRRDTGDGYGACEVTSLIEYRDRQAQNFILKAAIGAPEPCVADGLQRSV